MTCIVAMVEDGVVHMAGDKLGSNGYTKSISERSKVFINGDFLMGYTTSFRMGQLLEFSWNPPEKMGSMSDDKFFYFTVINSIKSLFKEDGFSGKSEEGGTFLIGYKGKLYKVQSDYAVFEVTNYTACGCGEDEAETVLFTFEKVQLEDWSIEDKLALAIQASSHRKVGVSVEHDYLSL